MLCLTRKLGQGVVLDTADGRVSITLTRVNGHLVFNIDAPRAVLVRRAELLDNQPEHGRGEGAGDRRGATGEA